MKLFLLTFSILLLSSCTIETNQSLHDRTMKNIDELKKVVQEQHIIHDACTCKSLPCLNLDKDTEMFLSDENLILNCVKATIDYRRNPLQ